MVYSGGAEARPFVADARELGQVLGQGPALMDLDLDGSTVPVVLKERQTDPVRGDDVHIDFFEVSLTEKIHSTVYVHLEGIEQAPGVVEGGIMEQPLREVSVEALPGDIPEHVTLDVSEMVIGDVRTLADLAPPRGVVILDDPETTVATLNPPALEEEEPEVEEEAELIGEEAEAVEAEGAEPEEGEEPSEGAEDEG